VAGGLAQADASAVNQAVADSCREASRDWEETRGAPPAVIWRRTLEEARRLAEAALLFVADPLPGQKSYSETPFGGQPVKRAAPPPWDLAQEVQAPGTGLRISGYIDRLDLSADGRTARVWDYKTGKTPEAAFTLNGGRELQRCLYGFATRQLLPQVQHVEAALLYPRDGYAMPLEDLDTVLADLARHLAAARESLLAGRALPGPDSGGDRDDFAFALPANPVKGYGRRKTAAVAVHLGPATAIWETP
jgi:hypothetical protein